MIENNEQNVLIHIGFPKSLSSWMQKKLFLPENGYETVFDPLLAKICIIDPPPFHFNPESSRQAFNNKTKTANLISVITAENLAGNVLTGGHDAEINAIRIKQCFPKAKILIIIREQISIVRSLYKTQINWGMPHNIEELLNPRPLSLIPEFSIEMLKYDRIIKHYQENYSKENVLVLPYECFIQNPNSFCQTIADFCGNNIFQSNKMRYHQKINTNRPLIDIYFDRIKNRLIKSAFNYNGLINETEETLNKRIKNSKSINRFPKFTQHWFEKSFSEKTAHLLNNRFNESNRITQELISIPLAQYGYQI